MAPTPPAAERENPGRDNDDNCITSIESPQFIINADSSSSDEGDAEVGFGYQGYQLLPHEPCVSHESDDELEFQSAEIGSVAPTFTTASSSVPSDSTPVTSESYLDSGAACPLTHEDSHEGVVDITVKQTLDAADTLSPGGGTSMFNVPAVEDAEGKERRELWQEPRSSSPSVSLTHGSMPDAQADQIKAALSGFSLPPSHTPDWAKTVPEDDWKMQLISRLKQHPKDTRALTSKEHSGSKPSTSKTSNTHETR